MTKENMYEGYVRILNDNYLGLPYIKVNAPEVKINKEDKQWLKKLFLAVDSM